MNDLHVYTVSTAPLAEVPLSKRARPDIMLASAAAFGVDLHVELTPAVGTSRMRHKIVGARVVLERLPPDDILLMSDGWDVFFSGNAAGILEEYRKLDSPVVISGECRLFPRLDEFANYPEAPTKYRYCNSGGIIGTVREYRELHDHYLATERWDPDWGCQRLWHSAFLARPDLLAIDYQCRIFQTLAQPDNGTPPTADLHFVDGRIHNRDTGSTPYLVHGNGPRTQLAVQLWEKQKAALQN